MLISHQLPIFSTSYFFNCNGESKFVVKHLTEATFTIVLNGPNIWLPAITFYKSANPVIPITNILIRDLFIQNF